MDQTISGGHAVAFLTLLCTFHVFQVMYRNTIRLFVKKNNSEVNGRLQEVHQTEKEDKTKGGESDADTNDERKLKDESLESLTARKEIDFQSTKYNLDQNTTSLVGSNAMENDLGDGSQWRCVCKDGFLPPGLLKSFGMMESMIRTSTGQCYHKTS